VPADTRRVRDAGSGALSNKPPHTRVCRLPQRRTGTVTRVGHTPTYRAPYRRGAPRRVTPSTGWGGGGGQAGACGCSRAQQGGGGAHETPRAAGTRGGGGRPPSVRCCACWCRPSVPVSGAFIGTRTGAGGTSDMVDAATRHGTDRHGVTDGGAAPIALLRSGVPRSARCATSRAHARGLCAALGRLQAPHGTPMRGARCGASPKQRQRRPTGVRDSVHATGAPRARWVWLQTSTLCHTWDRHSAVTALANGRKLWKAPCMSVSARLSVRHQRSSYRHIYCLLPLAKLDPHRPPTHMAGQCGRSISRMHRPCQTTPTTPVVAGWRCSHHLPPLRSVTGTARHLALGRRARGGLVSRTWHAG